MLASWRSMTKIAGSGSESGSISQRHGSADPDRPKMSWIRNIADYEQWRGEGVGEGGWGVMQSPPWVQRTPTTAFHLTSLCWSCCCAEERWAVSTTRPKSTHHSMFTVDFLYQIIPSRGSPAPQQHWTADSCQNSLHNKDFISRFIFPFWSGDLLKNSIQILKGLPNGTVITYRVFHVFPMLAYPRNSAHNDLVRSYKNRPCRDFSSYF